VSIQVKPIAIVLADISGYTKFTRYHAMAVMHAEQIITDLLETVISAAQFPLTVGKLEGDAVFFYASSDGPQETLASDVAKQAMLFFDAFRAKEKELISHPICICEACRNVGTLKLKVVMHHGNATFKQIQNFQEIGGADVDLARRLLKNSIPSKEYILMTEQFYTLSNGFMGQTTQRHSETLEDRGSVPMRVYFPTGSAETAPVLEPAKRTMWQRLRQYVRVNWHGILRWLGLRHDKSFTNLPR